MSAFFGVNDNKPSSSTKETKASNAKQPSRGRPGVGSTTSRVKETMSEDAIGRVLKVGKRNRHEEEQEDETASDQSDHEDEEVEGRTAIAQEKASNGPAAPSEERTEPKKTRKKKKGKKERQSEQAVAKEESAAPRDEANKAETDQAEQNAEEEPTQQQKTNRKRRKVRSRQKNIYKDKRLAQHKPGHLIPGRAEFQGRPMTAETRAKLHLPPSKSSRKQQETDDVNHAEMIENSSSGEGVKLAIDDLLGDDQDEQARDHDEHEAVGNAQTERKRKKKKKKRSKYKNLQ